MLLTGCSMQYHTAVILLFLPFLHVDGMAGSIRDELKHIILASAKSGLEILEQSKRLYSCRYQMPLIAFCSLHLGDVLMRYSPSEPYAPDVVAFCLEILKANRAGFAICGPLQDMFRKSAIECRVQLPSNIRELMKPAQHYGIDEILGACTRISYTQPVEQISLYIDTNIAKEWRDRWDKVIGPLSSNPFRKAAGGTEKVMHINWLLND